MSALFWIVRCVSSRALSVIVMALSLEEISQQSKKGRREERQKGDMSGRGERAELKHLDPEN